MQHRGDMSDISLAGESVNDVTANCGGPGDASISGISFAGQTPGTTHIDVDEVCLVEHNDRVPIAKIKQWLLNQLKKMDLQFSELPPEYWETLRRKIQRCAGEEEHECFLLQECVQGVVSEVEGFECTEAMKRWNKTPVTNSDQLVQLLSAFQESLRGMGILVDGLPSLSVGGSDELKKKRKRERPGEEAAAHVSNSLMHQATKGKGKGSAPKVLRHESPFTGHTKKRKKRKVRGTGESGAAMKPKRREDRYLVLKRDVFLDEGDDEENLDPKLKSSAGHTPHPSHNDPDLGLSARRKKEKGQSSGQNFEGIERRREGQENGGSDGHSSFPQSASSSASIRKPLRARNYRDAPDDTPWRCVSCDKGFKSRNALEAHLRVSPQHSGKAAQPTPPDVSGLGCGQLAHCSEEAGHLMEGPLSRNGGCAKGDAIAMESSQEQEGTVEEHEGGEESAASVSGREDGDLGSEQSSGDESDVKQVDRVSPHQTAPKALEREELSQLVQQLLAELQSQGEHEGREEAGGGEARYPWGGACPHCTEPYALEGSFLPKLLPCFHTVCLGCAGEAGRCPWCASTSESTPRGSGWAGSGASLPLNPLEMDRLLRRCGECGEGAPAIVACEECEVALCYRCRELHTRTPLFKRHALTALPQAEFVPRERCAGEGHGEAALEIYCKVCDRLFCSKGFLKEHSAEMHEYAWIQKMAPTTAAERVAAQQQQLSGEWQRVAARCERAAAGLARIGEDRGQLERQLESLIEAAKRLKTDTMAVYDETRQGETDEWADEYRQCRADGVKLRQATGFSAALAARTNASSVHDYQVSRSAQELLGRYLDAAEKQQRSLGGERTEGGLVSSVAFNAFRERLQHLNMISSELISNLAARTAGDSQEMAGAEDGPAPEQLRDRLLRFRKLLRPRPQTDDAGRLLHASGSVGGARLMGDAVSRVEHSLDQSMATACNVVLSTWHHLAPGIAHAGQ